MDGINNYLQYGEKQYNETISIPLWPDMTEEDAQTVIKAVKEIGKEFHA